MCFLSCLATKVVSLQLSSDLIVSGNSEKSVLVSNDRHRRVEGNCIALDTKVDRDVEDLYSKYDKTRFDDRKIFYELTLEERLRLPTYRKQQWVKRWKQNIGTSIIRATTDTATDTKEIYKYFNGIKRLKLKINRRRLLTHRRTYQRKRASMPLECKLHTFAV